MNYRNFRYSKILKSEKNKSCGKWLECSQTPLNFLLRVFFTTTSCPITSYCARNSEKLEFLVLIANTFVANTLQINEDFFKLFLLYNNDRCHLSNGTHYDIYLNTSFWINDSLMGQNFSKSKIWKILNHWWCLNRQYNYFLCNQVYVNSDAVSLLRNTLNQT